MKLEELTRKIIEWAKERNLHVEGTVEGQSIKTLEEMGELLVGICKGKKELIKDAIGDVYVTLIVGALLEAEGDEAKVINAIETWKGLCKGPLKSNLSLDGVDIYSIMYKRFYGDHVFFEDPLISDFNLLGHCLEGLYYLGFFYDMTLEECVEYAYNEIKDRKGKMVGGTFVKDE